MFFDTNIIILYLGDLLDTDLSTILKSSILNKKNFISKIVMIEVLAYSGYDEMKAKEIESFLRKNFKIIDITTAIALLASKIIRQNKINTGKKLKLAGAVIAATSIISNMPLMTLDKEDFKSIKDLKIVS